MILMEEPWMKMSELLVIYEIKRKQTWTNLQKVQAGAFFLSIKSSLPFKQTKHENKSGLLLCVANAGSEWRVLSFRDDFRKGGVVQLRLFLCCLVNPSFFRE